MILVFRCTETENFYSEQFRITKRKMNNHTPLIIQLYLLHPSRIIISTSTATSSLLHEQQRLSASSNIFSVPAVTPPPPLQLLFLLIQTKEVVVKCCQRCHLRIEEWR